MSSECTRMLHLHQGKKRTFIGMHAAKKPCIMSFAFVLLVDVHCPGICSCTSLLSAFAQEGSVFFFLLKELQLPQEKGA